MRLMLSANTTMDIQSSASLGDCLSGFALSLTVSALVVEAKLVAIMIVTLAQHVLGVFL